jgi:beta-glucosidase
MNKNNTGVALVAGLVFFNMVLTSCSKPVISERIPEYAFNEKYEPIIDSILKELTLEEKISMLHGNGKFTSPGLKKMGISDITYTDGPTGIREELERHSWKSLNLSTDSATFFPTGTALAATWNTHLAYRSGEGIGLEARARGKDILLAPGINIVRTPLCGRTFEYFTEDPCLNSSMVIQYVRGVQDQNVAACVKHFAANNQEYERGRIDVEMSEQALREIYLPGFKAAVEEAGAYAVMGAYNKFRGEYLCQNDYLNNKILKGEFGFKGIIISDWAATHNTVKSALGGLDIEMGTNGTDYDKNYMGLPLRDSVLAGKVPEEVINDKVKRILRVMLNCRKDKETRQKGEMNTGHIRNIVYNIASESIVLLKNENHVLPLDINKIKKVAIIGQNAVQPQSFGGATAFVKAKYEISPLMGITKKIGNKASISYAAGYRPQYDVIEGTHIKYPSQMADTALIHEAVEKASKADVAIIIAGTNREVETEGHDRRDIFLPFGQDELIKAVSRANKNTIVVIIAGAPCDLNSTTSSAPALLYAWYNGSEAGNALADILLGTINPSGKLPFTLPVKLEDIGAHALNAYPGKDLTVDYKESILVGYRWLDTKNIAPLFPFGHGLSYTSFEYSGLRVLQQDPEKLHVELTLKNTGKMKGKEVVQCYIRDEKCSVLRPYKELKAFQKIELSPGQSTTVSFNITKTALSFFNENSGKWTFEPGNFTIMTGSSSRDIRLTSSINIE